MKLFERGSKRVTPTAKGKALVGYAEQIVELRGAMRLVADQKAAARGRFQLGVSDTLVHTWFPKLVKRIDERFPLLTLEIQVDIKPNMITALRDRKLDIAFVTDPVVEPALKKVRLVSYPLAWVANTASKLPKQPIPLSEIAKRPIITHLRHSRTYDTIQDMLARDNVTNARLYTSSSISTTVTMILGGIGIGAIPTAVVAQELRAKKVRTLAVENAALPPYDFIAVYPSGPENLVAAAVAELAREIAGD